MLNQFGGVIAIITAIKVWLPPATSCLGPRAVMGVGLSPGPCAPPVSPEFPVHPLQPSLPLWGPSSKGHASQGTHLDVD